ncbi:50S ribosomal protein L29 [Natronogracilivirga saccharolytica]|uniref:Large ribosomal subunit protein uL29 n=1 Tax=Natronogracilivirga saccharolytica TaxID=2812953 RepID=A0A8J7RI74_9BACT|nr:50S ribosomal protein L29 [Natronogracilivirga saccharolytica]MBP3192265.1 50S ribosomal protein L29 [Natronogracilivirga saccharolytica]
MKAHELRDLSVAELEARIKDEIESLQKLYFNKAVAGQVESPATIKNHRKELARLYTVIREKKRAEQAEV